MGLLEAPAPCASCGSADGSIRVGDLCEDCWAEDAMLALAEAADE